MLQGDKPMALFQAEPGMDSDDIGDADFEPFVKDGRILRFTTIDSGTSVEERRYCRRRRSGAASSACLNDCFPGQDEFAMECNGLPPSMPA